MAEFFMADGDPDDIENLAAFVATLNGVERVEILPFHQMGAFKWKELGLEYKLEHTESPDQATLYRVRQQFAARGMTVY